MISILQIVLLYLHLFIYSLSGLFNDISHHSDLFLAFKLQIYNT